MARTASQRLAFWEELRDSVEDGLAAGVPVIAYTVDGQAVSKEPTEEWLTAIELRIARLRRESGDGLLSARNRLRRIRNVT